MKLWVRTFGCRANQYDSEAVRALAGHANVEVVTDVADADVAVFNSCAVTKDAVADLRQAVRRASRTRPDLRSVIMGCATAIPGADALRDLPGVEALVEGADMTALASALGVAPVVELATREQAGTRGLLRIQDGCDEHCTFCATTIARGANRSRSIASLVDEARTLAPRHREIVVTGVHIGTYGADRDATLGELMTALVRDVPEVRFRLTSIEATEVDDALLELMASEPRRLAPQIHAPLQSGSDAVLKRMGRHWYTATTYRAAIERMAARLPVFGLGADLITGFPGESAADHKATIALIESLPFSYLHVFPYSERPGTAAQRLGSPVSPDVAAARATELRELGAIKADGYRRHRAGQSADVIAIGSRASLTGLTEDYLETDLEGSWTRGERRPAVLVESGRRLLARGVTVP